MSASAAYWRLEAHAPVSKEAAEAAWSAAAHQRLAQLARSYHATIEHGQLAKEIQVSSGVRTRVPMRHWIGRALGMVADAVHAANEPPLTALVVQKGTGMVGEGYDCVLRVAGQTPLDDPVEREDHAARARLECYQWAGVSEPAGGWTPALAPALEQSRRRRSAASSPEKVLVLCATCHVVLPVSGQCDGCG